LDFYIPKIVKKDEKKQELPGIPSLGRVKTLV